MSRTQLPAIVPKFRTADGLSIRYAQSAEAGEVVVLLTSPWPESLLSFRSIWSQLAVAARLVAIDLPGFGKSERRTELLAPRAMSEFLATLIGEWELGVPHVIGPDVGTGATLFLAANHPGKLASAIVGSGGTSYPLDVGAGLKAIIDAPSIDGLRNVDSRSLVGPVLDAIKATLPAEVREDYLASYDGDRFAESARYVRAYPAELPQLAALLPSITIPVQIISGRHDPLVPSANGAYLKNRIPKSKLDILETGHFTWEDGAADYARIAAGWISGGYRQA